MKKPTHFGCDGCDELIPLSGYAIAQLAQNNPLSYQHKAEKGGCGISTYLDPHKYKAGQHMGSTKKVPKTCSVEGCEGEVAARGKCSTHYQQERRHERGEGRAPGEVKQIAKPGEGDQVTFKLDKTRKGKVTDVAERQGVDPSELYREGVDLLLALHTDRSEKWRKIRALLNAA